MANAVGYGLRSLRARFEVAGGRLDINNCADRGISLRFSLPMEDAK